MEQLIDDLDRGIIKLLSGDGRMSFTELAVKLNVTEKTIRTRYKNLVDHKILDVVGVVNPIALGLKSGAIIQCKVRPNQLQTTIEELQAFKEIRYITLTSGDYQLLTQINVLDQEALTETLKKISAISAIHDINFIVQLEVYKNTFEYL